MSSSSSSDKPDKLHRIFNSTPIAGCSHQLSAPTASEIGTNSSLNTVTAKPRRRIKKRKALRKANTVVARATKSTDSQWETRSERSICGDRSSLSSKNTPTSIHNDERSKKLPDALESPEQIREAFIYAPDNLLESPGTHRTRKALHKERWDDFDRADQILPVENIEPTIQREVLCEDEDRAVADDVLQIRRDGTTRTYPACRKPKNIEQKGNAPPTRNQFFNNPHRYLCRRVLSHGRVCTMKYIGWPETPKKKRQNDRRGKENIEPEMSASYGYSHRELDGWIRFSIELYNFPEKEDKAFEEGGKNGGRITFDEFRRRCRAKARNALRDASRRCFRDPE